MNIVTICIGELPEELREAAIMAQRERRRTGKTHYPYLTDECAEALKDEVMLTIWPNEHSFYITFDDTWEYVEVPDSEYPLTTERAMWYLRNMQPWTEAIHQMWLDATSDCFDLEDSNI